MTKQYLDKSGLTYFWGKLKNKFQDKLVSGTNIKTINNESLLGSGNITISGGGGTWGTISGTLSNQTDLQNALNAKQADLTLPLKYMEYIEDEEDYSCYYNYVINTESDPGTGIASGVYRVDKSICTQSYPEGILLMFGHGSGTNNQYMYTLKHSDLIIVNHASDLSYRTGDAITVISSNGSFITTKVKSVSSGITTLETITLENKEAIHHITSDLNQNRLMFVEDINMCDVSITQECYIDGGTVQDYTFPAGTLCFCKYGNVSSNNPGIIITPTGAAFKVTSLSLLTITMSTIKPYVDLTSNQTIGGVKTFSLVPVCATQPTSNNELANKAYVDAQAGGSSEVTLITQDTNAYTLSSGLYKVDSDNTDACLYIPLTSDFVLADAADETNQTSDHKYIKVTASAFIMVDKVASGTGGWSVITVIPSVECAYQEVYAANFQKKKPDTDTYMNNIFRVENTRANRPYYGVVYSYKTDEEITDEINTKATNYLAKNNTTLFTPTGDYNPATKKYVDDVRNLMKFTNWANLYSSGNNVVKYRYNAFMCEIRIYMQDAHTTDITTSALPSACRPSETVTAELTGEGLNYANLYTDGKITFHNNNAYAGGTMTYSLTN